MADVTIKQRKRGLEIAETVATIAAGAPDAFTKKTLYRAVVSIRKEFGFSESEKEAEVLRRILIGASTVNDLVRETGFPQPDVWRITRSLEKGGLVYFQSLSTTGNGRPATLIFPVENPQKT